MRFSRLTWITTAFALSAVALALTACSRQSGNPMTSQQSEVTMNSATVIAASGQGNVNGAGSAIPAYYDSMLFTIHFVELPATAEKTVLAHNSGLNVIYQSDPGLPGGQPFISVIDAIPGDGMNPLWQEFQITFNEGFTPRQLFSDDEIKAAASGTTPEITLTPTTEVYRCPVVAQKPSATPSSATPSSSAR